MYRNCICIEKYEKTCNRSVCDACEVHYCKGGLDWHCPEIDKHVMCIPIIKELCNDGDT